ncbi:hypothetical protein Gogos_005453 [Gossypium gossypioides]|uniref:Uncharacterized protein n=1 Tax=Gossypium gossypioides TaxID=34282 RepID=A0A7J9D3T3_GOSGO|nr:hypothetical protein [Gossypium gossypioides]
MDVIFKPWVPRELKLVVSQHVMTVLNVKPRHKSRTLPFGIIPYRTS